MDERQFILSDMPENCGDNAFSGPVLADLETKDGPETGPEEELNFHCPCCGRKGFSHEPDGSWDICPICGWEDDPVQLRDPDFAGGANELSLNQARAQFFEKNVKEGQIL